jgi:ribosomal protein L7/L12
MIMFTDTTHLEKVCEQKLQAGVTLDDVIEYLHVQGISILDAIKVVRNAGGMPLGDAKQVVSCHAAWQNIVKANEALHDESEAAVQDM